MLTVTLKPDVAEQITHLAGETQTNAEAVVDKAVRAYLVELRREKIRAETEAFERQRNRCWLRIPANTWRSTRAM